MEKIQQIRRYLKEKPADINESGDRSDYFEIFDILDVYGKGSHVFKIRPKRGMLQSNSTIEMELVDEGNLPIKIKLASESSSFENRFLPSHRLSFTVVDSTIAGIAVFTAFGITKDGKTVKYSRHFLIDKGVQEKPVIDRGLWTVGEYYDSGDMVLYSSSLYLGKIFHQAQLDNAPPDSTYWSNTSSFSFVISSSVDDLRNEVIQYSSSTSGILDGLDARVFTDATGRIIKTPTSSVSGLYTGQEYLGYYSGSSWRTFMGNNGDFFLTSSGVTNDGYVRWFSSQALLEVKGNLVLTSGESVQDYVGNATSSLSSSLNTAISSSVSNLSQSVVVTTNNLDERIFTDATGKINKPPSTSSAGLFLGNTHLGYYDGGVWKTYMDNQGDFYLTGSGGFLVWDSGNSTLNISGSLYSKDGNIAGWAIGQNSIFSNGTFLSASVNGGGLLVKDINNITRVTVGQFVTASLGNIQSGGFWNGSVSGFIIDNYFLEELYYGGTAQTGSIDLYKGLGNTLGINESLTYNVTFNIGNVVDSYIGTGDPTEWTFILTSSLRSGSSTIANTTQTHLVQSGDWYGTVITLRNTYLNTNAYTMSNLTMSLQGTLNRNDESQAGSVSTNLPSIFTSYFSYTLETPQVSITPQKALFSANAYNYLEWTPSKLTIRTDDFATNNLNVTGNTTFAGNTVFSGSMVVLGQLTVSGSLASHPVIPAIPSINNSSVSVIQDLGFDVFGHVTSSTSVNLATTNFSTFTSSNSLLTTINNTTLTSSNALITTLNSTTGTITNLSGTGATFTNITASTQLNSDGTLRVQGTSTFSGSLTLNDGVGIIFTDKRGIYPTNVNSAFIWDLNNDSARIYAYQPSSDNIDFVFKITDNALATDRFIFWVDDYLTPANDAYPLYMDGTRFVVNYPSWYGGGLANDIDFFVIASGSSNLNNPAFYVDSKQNTVAIGTRNTTFRFDVDGTGRFTQALQLDTQATATNHAVAGGRSLTISSQDTNKLTLSAGAQDLTSDRTWTISLVTGSLVTGSNNNGITITNGVGRLIGTSNMSINLPQRIDAGANPTFNDLTTTGNVSIAGNLTVLGGTFSASVETVLIQDNLLVINDGETGVGVTAGIAGIEVERGSLDNFLFVFRESDDRFVVGTSGSLQVVATRMDDSAMTSFGVPFYNSTANRFDTNSGFTYSASIASITGRLDVDNIRLDGNTISTISGDLTLDSAGQVIIQDATTINNTTLVNGQLRVDRGSDHLIFRSASVNQIFIVNKNSDNIRYGVWDAVTNNWLHRTFTSSNHRFEGYVGINETPDGTNRFVVTGDSRLNGTVQITGSLTLSGSNHILNGNVTHSAGNIRTFGNVTIDGNQINIVNRSAGVGLEMGNSDINNVNILRFSDPGFGEGILWSNTNAKWTIDVSPLNRSNADGNLNLSGSSDNIVLWRPALFINGASITGSLTVSGSGFTNVGSITQTGDSRFNGSAIITSSFNSSTNILLLRNSNTGTSAYTELAFGNDVQEEAFTIGYGGNNQSSHPSHAFILQRRNAPMWFGTNGSERMRIQSNGNVSIGKTGSNGVLDVVGNTYITGSLIASGSTHTVSGRLDVSNGTSTIAGTNINNAWIKVGSNLGLDPNEIYFASIDGNIGTIGNYNLLFNTNALERMRITSTGNVGIGNNNPQWRVDVGGSINTDASYRIDGKIVVTDNDIDTVRYGSDNAERHTIIRANGTDTIYVSSSLVSIGTSTLREDVRLNVNGNIGVEGNNKIILGSDGASNTWAGFYKDGSYIKTVNNFPLFLSGSTNEQGTLVFDNSLTTPLFASGFAGFGARLDQDENDKWALDLDNLTVRGRMRIYELLINQIRATNGAVWVSSTGKITSGSVLLSGTIGVSGSTYRLYTDSGSNHGFAVNDLIRAQRFTGNDLYQINMVVTHVANTTTFSASLAQNEPYLDDVSKFKDVEFVRIGNTTDVTRQGAVYLTSDDSGAPYIDIIDGISSFNTFNTAGTQKVRLGKLSGITDTNLGLVGQNVYGIYTDAGYFKGNVIVGGNVNTASLASNTIALGRITGTATKAIRISLNDDLQDSGLFGYNDAGENYIRLALSGSSRIAGLYIDGNDLWSGNSAKNNVATRLVLSSQDQKIALGESADSINLTSSGILLSGSGEFNFGYDASNYIRRVGDTFSIASTNATLSGSNVSITVNNLDLTAGTVFKVTTANNGLIALGGLNYADAEVAFSGSGIGKFGSVNIDGNNGGRIYIGTGTYNNINTSFFVSGSGIMSLKNTFTWDGTNLKISGSTVQLIADDFVLGGSTSYISGSNGTLRIQTGDATLSGSSVQILTPNFYLGGASNFISGSNGNIRIKSTNEFELSSSNVHISSSLLNLGNKLVWNGSTLTVDGSGTFSGTITASGGLIAGWTIASNSIWKNVPATTSSLYLYSSAPIHNYPSLFFDNAVTNQFVRISVGQIYDGSTGWTNRRGFALYDGANRLVEFSTDGTTKIAQIAGWNFDNTKLSRVVQTYNVILGNTKTTDVGLLISSGSNHENEIHIFKNANDPAIWGISGKVNNATIFRLGSTNNIAGWDITATTLAKNNITLNSNGFLSIGSGASMSANGIYLSGSGEFNFQTGTNDYIRRSGNTFEVRATNAILSSSNVQILTPNFYLGGTSNFISGSGGNIQIKASNTFELSSSNILVSGSEFRLKNNFTWDGSNLLVSGSNVQVLTDKFFLGNATNFVSGSGGTIVISGSSVSVLTPNFYLGGANNFISGSGGNIRIKATDTFELSSSNIVVSGSRFALKTSFVWDGTNLNVSGSSVTVQTSNFYLGNSTNYISGSGTGLAIVTGQATLSGSSVNILTPNFYLGGASNFISGSSGNIQIKATDTFELSSSNILVSGSEFRLKNNFTWDGTNLTVSGSNVQVLTDKFYLGNATNYISGSGTQLKIVAQDATLSGSSVQVITPNFLFGNSTNYISGSGGNITISGSNVNVLTSQFFFGDGTTNISGSGGVLTITSNNFGLDSSGNVRITGSVNATTINAQNGNIGGWDLSSTSLNKGGTFLSSSANGGGLLVNDAENTRRVTVGRFNTASIETATSVTWHQQSFTGGLRYNIPSFTISGSSATNTSVITASIAGTLQSGENIFYTVPIDIPYLGAGANQDIFFNKGTFSITASIWSGSTELVATRQTDVVSSYGWYGKKINLTHTFLNTGSAMTNLRLVVSSSFTRASTVTAITSSISFGYLIAQKVGIYTSQVSITPQQALFYANQDNFFEWTPTNIRFKTQDFVTSNLTVDGNTQINGATVVSGSLIVLGDTTISGSLSSHPVIPAIPSIDNSNVTVIQDLGFDMFGHVTGGTSVNLATTTFSTFTASNARITTFNNTPDFKGGLISTGSILHNGNITIAGNLRATSKNFYIHDKKNKGKHITYASVETNKNDVYISGHVDVSENEATITFPQEWEWLVDENTVRVTLTPTNTFQNLFVRSKSSTCVFISKETTQSTPSKLSLVKTKIWRLFGINKKAKHPNELTQNTMSFDYVIYATRKDIPPLEVYD